MAETKVKIESHLPIRGFLVVFLTVLVIVAVTASIFGENQKVNISSRRFMDFVASRDYEDAYGLLTQKAQKQIDLQSFQARMALLRVVLRGQFGANFNTDYKFTSIKEFWIPWLEVSRVTVTVGLYRKESSVTSELKELVMKPKTEGDTFKNLLVVVREDGRWMIDAVNFNPDDYKDVLASVMSREKVLYTPNENGFVFEGFVYDRRVASPEERALLMDSLTQALETLQEDAGLKKPPSNDLMKLVP